MTKKWRFFFGAVNVAFENVGLIHGIEITKIPVLLYILFTPFTSIRSPNFSFRYPHKRFFKRHINIIVIDATKNRASHEDIRNKKKYLRTTSLLF